MVYPINSIQDSFIKFRWVTKTALVNDLPSNFSYKPIDEALLDDIECRATEALVFQRPPPESREPYQAFFQSLLASAWIRGEEYPHLLQSHLMFDPKIMSYWKRDGVNYVCQPHPLFSLHTTHPLELFSGADFTGENPVPSISFQPAHNSIFDRAFDQIHLSGGCRRYGPYPFAHTLFLHSASTSFGAQPDTVALLNLFGQSAGYTVQEGFSFREDLRYPLSTQAVVAQGNWLSFYCYQLNTLDLSPKNGEVDFEAPTDERVNIIWVGPKMKLYEDIEPGVKLIGFNRECATMLLQFLFNDKFKELPEVSGHDLLRAKELRKLAMRKDMRKKLIATRRAKTIARVKKNEWINKTFPITDSNDTDKKD